MEAYRRAFIQTGSLAPLKHVMAGVFVMAFGMEHYFHHKYHSHAEGAHDHKEAEVDMTKVDAALPAAAAAAMAEKPLPADMDALTAEIKSLRAEIGTLRAGMREAAEEANKKK
ncbi:predicted protein [Micromonas commoda]|uniref:Uncharacterized protein n=1 Tax=Micromonas commoda (strain RCC299 / NOUM17 / CCMP2709) TaxID=296587 RepID=C1E484_MICCC|nr:predicted protein [Micromonas commoda]ACO62679.1 predicted protein [Micromonas commoda]|eukprot:XP_002501421.1 predicted protein [Micromonas commoda]